MTYGSFLVHTKGATIASKYSSSYQFPGRLHQNCNFFSHTYGANERHFFSKTCTNSPICNELQLLGSPVNFMLVFLCFCIYMCHCTREFGLLIHLEWVVVAGKSGRSRVWARLACQASQMRANNVSRSTASACYQQQASSHSEHQSDTISQLLLPSSNLKLSFWNPCQNLNNKQQKR